MKLLSQNKRIFKEYFLHSSTYHIDLLNHRPTPTQTEYLRFGRRQYTRELPFFADTLLKYLEFLSVILHGYCVFICTKLCYYSGSQRKRLHKL